MNKKIIAIASILKPLHDPRHYERFALSLAKTNKYEVNIIANGEKKPDTDQIKFHSNGLNNRKFFKRISLQWKTIRRIIEIRPDLLIICTIELLPFAFFYSLFYPCKIIYDVQENYRLNFKYQSEYGWIAKHIGSPIMAWLERRSTGFIALYFLAENCYYKQLSFTQKKHVILENKTVVLTYEKNVKNKTINGKINLLFSGTISHYSGVDRITQLVSDYSTKKIDYHLTIIGQVVNKKIRNRLESISSKKVKLIIDTQPIPHDQIITEITRADLGIIAYQPNPVNAEKVPTKLYEYAAYNLPYLIEEETNWASIGLQLGGAIPVNFESLPSENISELLHSASHSFIKSNHHLALWESEESKFIKSIDTLLNS